MGEAAEAHGGWGAGAGVRQSDNILVNSAGQVKLADFGFCVQLTQETQMRHSMVRARRERERERGGRERSCTRNIVRIYISL